MRLRDAIEVMYATVGSLVHHTPQGKAVMIIFFCCYAQLRRGARVLVWPTIPEHRHGGGSIAAPIG